MKKIFALVLTVCLLLPLVACGQKGEEKKDDAEETKTISGIVNKLDSYLVLLDSDGDYHIFDYGEDVDQSTLEEGDKITAPTPERWTTRTRLLWQWPLRSLQTE